MTDANKSFEAVVYEKAEHWTFNVTVTAPSEEAARKILAREYPKRSYSVREIRQNR